MNPLALRLRNYRTFEHLDLDLPEGCVGILGQNGAGKSSVVNAIDLGLFGPDGRSWAPYLTLGAVGTELMVELTFEHAGELYRVRRGFSGRGAGKSTLDLEKRWSSSTENGRGLNASAAHAAGWEPLTLGTAKDTQARLDAVLGFTRRTLRASSLLLQGDGAAFTEADPRDRKRILADALGLDRFERRLAAVRRDRRAGEQQVAMIDGRLQGVTAESLRSDRAELDFAVKALAGEETKVNALLAAAEAKLLEAAEAVQVAQALEGERAAAVARRDAAAVAFAAKDRWREEALEASGQAAAVKEEIDTLPTADQAARLEQREAELVGTLDTYRDAVRARDETIRLRDLRETEKRTIEAQATSTHDRMRELDSKAAHVELGEIESCPVCEQQLGIEARTATIGSLRAQAQTLADEAEALFERAAAVELPEIPVEPEPPVGAEGELAAVRQRLRDVAEAQLQRARLLERMHGLSAKIMVAAEPAFLEELATLEQTAKESAAAVAALPTPPDLAPLQGAAVTAKLVTDGHRTRLEQLRRDQAVQQERLDQVDQRITQHTADLIERDRLTYHVGLLTETERAFGPDGLPAWHVEKYAIPMIEVEANRILTMLGGTTADCQVELRTGRAKADGGLRDDVLDITVISPEGEREYQTFSGGERTRLNLALRIALARLLATRRGAESRLLAIDEPEFLDEDGTAALVDVLRELEQQRVFDRVYLVSHVPALRDSFDQTLEVVKENGRSHVVGAEVVAAVA